jgi:hypothetical protein
LVFRQLDQNMFLQSLQDSGLVVVERIRQRVFAPNLLSIL